MQNYDQVQKWLHEVRDDAENPGDKSFYKKDPLEKLKIKFLLYSLVIRLSCKESVEHIAATYAMAHNARLHRWQVYGNLCLSDRLGNRIPPIPRQKAETPTLAKDPFLSKKSASTVFRLTVKGVARQVGCEAISVKKVKVKN